jgi:hypothetical protein
VLEKDECRSTLASPNLLLACLFKLRPCVIPKPGWIVGDWSGITPSQVCGGLNPDQSTPIPLLTRINEHGLSGNKNSLDHILAMKAEDSIIILKSAQSNPRLKSAVHCQEGYMTAEPLADVFTR